MDKYVIYFAGGSMRGIFGAGVATAFEKANIYPKINAIYTASAGAMTGAYFLAKQMELGSSIYWEDLKGDSFISRRNFFIGVWQRFQNRFIRGVPQDKLYDALDINHLINVAKNNKSLDISKIISQDIPLYVKLFNLNTNSIEYIDARRPDILEIIKAGISMFPYVHEIPIIDGKKYIDAAIMDIIGFAFLRQKHPNEKIIVVMNGQIDRKLRYRAKNIIEGKFMQWMFDKSIFYKLYTSAEDKLAEDIKKIKSDPNSLLITLQKDISVRCRTTNPKSLLEMYNLGIKAGNYALKNSL